MYWAKGRLMSDVEDGQLTDVDGFGLEAGRALRRGQRDTAPDSQQMATVRQEKVSLAEYWGGRLLAFQKVLPMVLLVGGGLMVRQSIRSSDGASANTLFIFVAMILAAPIFAEVKSYFTKTTDENGNPSFQIVLSDNQLTEIDPAACLPVTALPGVGGAAGPFPIPKHYPQGAIVGVRAGVAVIEWPYRLGYILELDDVVEITVRTSSSGRVSAIELVKRDGSSFRSSGFGRWT